MRSPWPFFNVEELRCKCGCGEWTMDNAFMWKIVAMRRELGFPFIVTSGFRCPEYNNKVSTTGFDGPHTTGHALDIAVSRTEAYHFTKKAFEIGLTGLGFQQKGSSRFIHVDDLKTPPRPNIWSY